jgi:hypothetical protein
MVVLTCFGLPDDRKCAGHQASWVKPPLAYRLLNDCPSKLHTSIAMDLNCGSET